MKIELFNVARPNEVKELKKFIEEHQIIDIKLSAGVDVGQVIVMYDDQSLKVKYFDESDYPDLSDSYARMQSDVNKFCSSHYVVDIETTQNNDEDLVTVVTYKE